MAAMTSVLLPFSTLGNTRTFEVTSPSPEHTALSPFIVIQKRKVPTGNSVMMEDSFILVRADVDANGPLSQRTTLECKIRRNQAAVGLDIANIVFRDIIASDEFDDMLTFQRYLAT